MYLYKIPMRTIVILIIAPKLNIDKIAFAITNIYFIPTNHEPTWYAHLVPFLYINELNQRRIPKWVHLKIKKHYLLFDNSDHFC